MIYRYLTGKISLAGVAILAILVIGQEVLFKQWQDLERQDAMTERFAPAMKKLVPEALADSDWRYTGPLGELDLHFHADGKLTVSSDDGESSGSWEVKHQMLTAQIPGSDKAHTAIFKDSVSSLLGASPKRWSAERIVE